MQFVVAFCDYAYLCGVRIERPEHICPAEWLTIWEKWDGRLIRQYRPIER